MCDSRARKSHSREISSQVFAPIKSQMTVDLCQRLLLNPQGQLRLTASEKTIVEAQIGIGDVIAPERERSSWVTGTRRSTKPASCRMLKYSGNMSLCQPCKSGDFLLGARIVGDGTQDAHVVVRIAENLGATGAASPASNCWQSTVHRGCCLRASGQGLPAPDRQESHPKLRKLPPVRRHCSLENRVPCCQRAKVVAAIAPSPVHRAAPDGTKYGATSSLNANRRSQA